MGYFISEETRNQDMQKVWQNSDIFLSNEWCHSLEIWGSIFLICMSSVIDFTHSILHDYWHPLKD